MLLTGCTAFFPGHKRTRVIAVPFGLTTQVTKFKVGIQKPYAHVIWGTDIQDGAKCTIVITNVTTAIRVYRRDFVHNTANTNKGYNYERSRIVEIDPEWYSKIGKYLLELYVDGRCISRNTFYILP